jgi:hypothetical protein
VKKSEKLTFPIADTLPGPGIYKGETDVSENGNKVPAVKSEKSITELGHGTAYDVSSTSLTPDKDEKR